MKNRPAIWQRLRIEILNRDEHRCIRCGIEEKKKHKIGKFVEHFNNLEVDHILPIELGGSFLNVDNLQTLCVNCHAKKNRWDQSLIAKLKRINKEKLKIFKEVEK